MSDSSTDDDDEEVAPWLRAAMSSCPGLVSEAALANAKRKREQEEADEAFARQLQLEEEVAADAAAAERREEVRRAEARLVRDSPRRVARGDQLEIFHVSQPSSQPRGVAGAGGASLLRFVRDAPRAARVPHAYANHLHGRQ